MVIGKYAGAGNSIYHLTWRERVAMEAFAGLQHAITGLGALRGYSRTVKVYRRRYNLSYTTGRLAVAKRKPT